MKREDDLTLQTVRYIKIVPIGSINPNSPVSPESERKQMEYLNRCLNDYPRGVIIGKDISIGSYRIGEHTLTMERTNYHVGFSRKPQWITD